MDKTPFLDIDVAMAQNACCPLLEDGTEARAFTIANNLPGAQHLVKEILVLMERSGFNRLLIGLEATNLYWWHLACFLTSCPELAPFQPRVYAFNPRLMRAFKKAVAERLRFGRLPAPFMVNEVYQPLQRLTRFRCHLMHQITTEKNYFLTFLFLKFSEYQNLGRLSKTFGATSQAVLMDYLTVHDIAARLPWRNWPPD